MNLIGTVTLRKSKSDSFYVTKDEDAQDNSYATINS